MSQTTNSERNLTLPFASGSGHRSTTRVFLLTLVGSLLIQSAWFLTVPPFLGMDENQHATKAAAVAHGDWSARHSSAGSFGGVVQVPESLVSAGRPVCELRATTDRYNCRPIAHLGNGMVTVTSLAAGYNPLFYAVVGIAGRPFSGYTSFFMMRAVAALLCALMIALAAAVLTRWATTRAPLVALQIAAAPVLWYSTTVLAPNGLEMCAGLVLWSALLGCIRLRGQLDRFTILAGASAACLLGVLRGAGPIWLLLILVMMLLITPRATIRSVVSSSWVRWSAVATTVAVVYGAVWTLVSLIGVHPIPAPHNGSSLAALRRGSPLWALGTYAMYPTSVDAAPIAVYLAGLVVWSAFIGIAFQRASAAIRVAAALVTAIAAIIPVALTALAYHQIGLFWQGRYALPLVVGVALLLGYALDAAGKEANKIFICMTLIGTLSSNYVSLISLVHRLLAWGADFPGWWAPSGPILFTLVSTGTLMLLFGILAPPGARNWETQIDTSKAASVPTTSLSS